MSSIRISEPETASTTSDGRDAAPKRADFVSYEGEPLAELTIDDVDYRLDPDGAGTTLCVSSRQNGTWAWEFLGEARWDGLTLRARSLERDLRERLAKALREVSAEP